MMRTLNATYLLLFLPVLASGGEWHVAGSLRCGDCHLQHASSQLEPIVGAFSYLLKENSINELCLSCHDGTNPTAPDVQSPVQMYSATQSQESGAGHFGLMGIDNLMGHAIGLFTTTPLQSISQSQELNCASCHAVHGNGNYRNLSHDPAGNGSNIQIFDGTDLITLNKPTDPPTTIGSSAAYARDNIAYLSTQMNVWCVSCHDQLANNSSSAFPAHFNGHPSNVALNEFSVDSHTDADHWVAGIGEGFTPVSGDGILRVPYLAPQATTFEMARIPQVSNRVGCVSCHKAHGSNLQRGMLWPYLEGGAGYVSGCQQCHNK
jgi:hypothetical protein